MTCAYHVVRQPCYHTCSAMQECIKNRRNPLGQPPDTWPETHRRTSIYEAVTSYTDQPCLLETCDASKTTGSCCDDRLTRGQRHHAGHVYVRGLLSYTDQPCTAGDLCCTPTNLAQILHAHVIVPADTEGKQAAGCYN